MEMTDPLKWLLEADPANPGVRYFALRDLLDRPEEDAEVRQAQAAVMQSGPVPVILASQQPEGFWVKSGSGYSPKYQSTVWQIIFLAELGADPQDERVQRGCEYLLSHSMASIGAFSANRIPVPSGVLHCLNGNLLSALVRLGYGSDPRFASALDWQARATASQAEVEFFQSGTSGPGFRCGVNLDQPCGWGAVKALKAFSQLAPHQHTPEVQQAIAVGVEFLFSRDPAAADYPYSEKVGPAWFKLGFPLSYWSDVLETVEVLADLGCGSDARLSNAVQFVLNKQDSQGRWKLENSLNGKMWVDIEKKGKPSKWVTLRALRVLKRTACMV
jgi:hypothetical protein